MNFDRPFSQGNLWLSKNLLKNRANRTRNGPAMDQKDTRNGPEFERDGPKVCRNLSRIRRLSLVGQF